MYDMANMKKLRQLGELAPDAWKAFGALNDATFAEGALSTKTKELMALAVALTTQCAYCLEVHRRAAVKAGATEEEIAETVMVTAALRAGGAVAHAGHVLG